MRVRVIEQSAHRDVILTVADPDVELATILRAIGVPGPPELVLVDDTPTRVDAPISAAGLHDGSTVRLDPAPTGTAQAGPDRQPGLGTPPAQASVPATVEIVSVAGPAAGRRQVLPDGVHDFGAADSSGRIGAPELRLRVQAEGADVSIVPVGRAMLRVDGLTVAEAVMEPGQVGTVHVSTPHAMLRCGPVAPRVRPLPYAPGGRLRYLRGPRVSTAAVPEIPLPPERPTAPTAASPLPWALVIAPIPLAIVMAIVISPTFLAFAAFTPLLSLARWLEGVIRARRSLRAEAAQWAASVAEYDQALVQFAARVSAQRRRSVPDLAQLLEAARDGRPGLWARRPGTAGFGCSTVGYGEVPAGWPLPHADPELSGLAARHRKMVDVPVWVDLDSHHAVGVHGAPGAARRLAGTIVAQLAATHGPADLELALICDPDQVAVWDWLKWLPQAVTSRGSTRVATSLEDLTTVIESSPLRDRTGLRDEPLRVVVVDSARMLDQTVARLARGAGRHRLLVIDDGARALPAICTQIVSISDGEVTLSDLTRPSVDSGLLPVIAAEGVLEELARCLARFSDPEVAASGAGLPEAVDLALLLGARPAADQVAQWWRERRPDLTALLGATEDGPLAVDLIADGPHALAAGTTGAGKSELLRTLIASLACRYSPEQVNFVLLDFKGGGAFDACADLPHTVGVVTDLDDRLAARALRCLRAEVGHRERFLRSAGVSDVRDLPDQAGDRLPRLILVIDEFATLAAELPSFLNALVDIAQRGRSLGIHLVLATQRPSGVVDAKIRANTNLRLALRVQSDADSVDVLGTGAAATIDRRRPGRGYALLGADELVGFQTAYVSGRTPRDRQPSVIVRPCRVEPSGSSAERPAPAHEAGPSDLEQIIEATLQAARGLPAPRVPWPDPLPARLSSDDLPERTCPGAVPLGLLDLPDEQRIEVFGWAPAEGSMLAYGVDPATTGGVIVSTVAALAARLNADRFHAYLLDLMPGSGLERLGGLPQVAARIETGDHERLLRVIERLERTIAERTLLGREQSAREPLVLFGLTGYSALLSAAEEMGRLDLPGRVERIIVEGPQVGVVTIATAPFERGIPSRVAGQVPRKLLFALADPAGYQQFGVRPSAVPDLQGDQALATDLGCVVVIARPSVIRCAADHSTGPEPIGVLGTDVAFTELASAEAAVGSRWRVPIGLRHDDLRTAVASLSGSFTVTGPPESGRTTALRAVVRGAEQAVPGLVVRVVTSRELEWEGYSPLTRVPLEPALIVVDGLDAVTSEIVPLLEKALGENDIQVVVADRPDAFRLPAPWLREVLSTRSGLLLQPQPDHGDLLRTRLPLRVTPHPPGRGYLVEAGLASLIQVAKA